MYILVFDVLTKKLIQCEEALEHKKSRKQKWLRHLHPFHWELCSHLTK